LSLPFFAPIRRIGTDIITTTIPSLPLAPKFLGRRLEGGPFCSPNLEPEICQTGIRACVCRTLRDKIGRNEENANEEKARAVQGPTPRYDLKVRPNRAHERRVDLSPNGGFLGNAVMYLPSVSVV